MQVSDKFTYKKLIDGLKNNRFKRVVVLTGAGISVSAGIPDFRSPKTGIYANLKKYNLPYPEAIFDLDYFLRQPEPFYQFCKTLDLDKYEPTPTHYFIKLLQQKGLLQCMLTQNIDNLEVKAGLDMENVVQAHGAYRGAHCAECQSPYEFEDLKKAVTDGKVMNCKWCKGPVKPEIVFFGENLDSDFYKHRGALRREGCDLILIMGSSLAVAPFNHIPQDHPQTPQVLINLENTKPTIDFTKDKRKLFLRGQCDETIGKLVQDLGWSDEFKNLLKKPIIEPPVEPSQQEKQRAANEHRQTEIKTKVESLQNYFQEVKKKKGREVQMLAVSKYQSVEDIKTAYEAGQRAFGENYVDELLEKTEQLPTDVQWHFIGHLQSNKVKKLVQATNLVCISSVDSQKLADKINSEVGKTNRLQTQGPLPVLVQVNVGQEDTKFGVDFNETPYLVEHIVDKCPNLLFRGLMGMGKIGDLTAFRNLAILRNTLLAQLIPDRVMHSEADFVLSMGTSADFEAAVGQGASQVRLGTSLFGARKAK